MTVIQPVNVPQPVKLTIEQFEMLDASGVFDGYAKTELIEGTIYAMQRQFRPHAYAKSELAYRLRSALAAIGSDLFPIVEGTVVMAPRSAPEPDIALTNAPKGDKYIPLESVSLVVEVSDSRRLSILEKRRRSTPGTACRNIGYWRYPRAQSINSGNPQGPAIARADPSNWAIAWRA